MGKLFKYEFRKTLVTKFVILGITLLAEIVFLCGLWSNKENTWIIGVLLLTFTATGGIMFLGLQSVLTLHRDMNTKQSYMLFMTPNSCYKILGAKAIENFLSIMLGGAFFFGLGVLDIALLLKHYDELEEIWEILSSVLSAFGLDLHRFDAGFFASIAFCLVAIWFAAITAAFLADVVSSSLLNGKKLNLLLSFALFIALICLMFFVISKLNITAFVFKTLFTSAYIWTGVIALGFAALFYVGAAELMQRKLSV